MQSRIPVIRPRFPVDHTGIRRIFEGRLDRRRAFLASGPYTHNVRRHSGPAGPGPLIDHPINIV